MLAMSLLQRSQPSQTYECEVSCVKCAVCCVFDIATTVSHIVMLLPFMPTHYNVCVVTICTACVNAMLQRDLVGIHLHSHAHLCHAPVITGTFLLVN